MIDVANKYVDELKKKFFDTWGKEKYKYWQINGYDKGCPDVPETNYGEAHFVILNNDDIIGYVSYNINRQTRCVWGFEAVNFSDNRILFGLSMFRILKNIFEKDGFNKINFNVAVGNPIEKSYDKFIEKYGGRIVGYYKDDIILSDGTLCDYKLYEIMRVDYIKNKELLINKVTLDDSSEM